MILIDFTLSNARRFYSSMGNPPDTEGLNLPVICFQNCPKLVHNLMLNCWESDKIKRPTFADIVDSIDNFLRSPEDLNDGLSPVAEKYVTSYIAMFSENHWYSCSGHTNILSLSSLLCNLFA